MKIQLRLVTTVGTNYSREGGTYPNLFDAHPPFQIDGNFGFVSGVDEMLFQSQETYTNPKYPDEDLYVIHLLPALPDKWTIGSIKGVRARGGFELDIEWAAGKLSKATVRSISGKAWKVRYGSKLIELFLEPGKTVVLNGDLVAWKN
jgi:alpha-L-fucosidase 2